ncbi:AmmeMemoRadiSam system radical SAM enzyme [Christensenellaceae bacterium OttesenSCG-928-K19]|nr:AmmeMemoRadiSam system radical SAM enzyme [Christensenellaceae bacterium OttesenSCG-928-K19]
MKTVCAICLHTCALSPGQAGLCGARVNENGKIVAQNYGMLTALVLDPIEKKPLARFHPGSYILSAGSYGCNLKCPFCQNSDISMPEGAIPATYTPPEALVEKALSLQSNGNIGIAYTYNEPLVGYEYVLDCATLAHKNGLFNVAVTNGMVCPAPLEALLPHLDAMNIDLKAFTQAFYDKVGGDLDAVKNSIALAAKHCHVEVTTLIIPGENDSQQEIEALAAWLASVNPKIPLHVSRFFPRFHMTEKPPTPVQTIYALASTARKHLKYVYEGNC